MRITRFGSTESQESKGETRGAEASDGDRPRAMAWSAGGVSDGEITMAYPGFPDTSTVCALAGGFPVILWAMEPSCRHALQLQALW